VPSPPPPSSTPAPRAASAGLPLVPPPPKDEPIVRAPPPVAPAPWTPPAAPKEPGDPSKAGASRPSKDDLAALDALLNSRTLEGPLAPMERAPAEARWTPQFTAAPERASADGAGRKIAMLGGGAVLLAALALGAYWMLNRNAAAPSSPPPTVARATPAPSTLRSATATTLPAVRPTAPTPPPPTAPAATRPGPVDLGTARTLMRQGRLDEAARGFEGNVRRAPAGTFSVQLLVACSAETVQKAVTAVDSPELYIVPVQYQGRDCYRMCWGLYPSGNRAQSAVRGLPDYFRVGGAKPRVMATAELLP
jgi:septal ring-binding cell division protein DamX